MGTNSSLSKFFIGLRTFPFCNITILDTVDSTNEWLKKNGEKHGQLVFAKEQTAGKGTKGRSFFSPDQTGLYFSILLTEKLTPDHAKLITSVAAASVAEAVEIICGVDAKIKWINDIIVDGKKAGGILCESIMNDKGEVEKIIIGIGINLFEPADGFGELSEIAGAVKKKGSGMTFNHLAAEAINRIRIYSEDILNKHYLEVCREKSCTLGREITVVNAEGKWDGKALSINDEGELEVEKENGDRVFLNSADVSIR